MEGLRLVGERTVGPGTVKRLEEKRRLTPCEVGLVLKILTTLQTTQGYIRRSSIESTRDSIWKEKNAAPHESAGDSKKF